MLQKLDKEKVLKFRDILYNKMGRMCVKYYEHKKCQKQVFVERIFKLLIDKAWYSISYRNDGVRNGNIIFYLMSINYYLGYGEEIDIAGYTIDNEFKTIKLNILELLDLRYRKLNQYECDFISDIMMEPFEKTVLYSFNNITPKRAIAFLTKENIPFNEKDVKNICRIFKDDQVFYFDKEFNYYQINDKNRNEYEIIQVF